jgi:hypothetical protein
VRKGLAIGARIDSADREIHLCRRRFCQGSSVVEQGTHKPLVGSSNLPPGRSIMPWVYILRGSSGARYRICRRFGYQISATPAPPYVHTRRLGEKLELVAAKEVQTLNEARSIERFFKAKKNPKLPFIICSSRAAPKAFGVGREFESPPGSSLSRSADCRLRIE